MNEQTKESERVSDNPNLLVGLLDRWEKAYNGYAINAVPMRERAKFTTHHSKENIGALVNETRDALSKSNNQNHLTEKEIE